MEGKDSTTSCLRELREKLNLHSSNYEKSVIMRYLNAEIEDQQIKPFCNNFSLVSLIKQSKHCKSPTNPTRIDLILTNTPQSFHSTYVLETGLPEF